MVGIVAKDGALEEDEDVQNVFTTMAEGEE